MPTKQPVDPFPSPNEKVSTLRDSEDYPHYLHGGAKGLERYPSTINTIQVHHSPAMVSRPLRGETYGPPNSCTDIISPRWQRTRALPSLQIWPSTLFDDTRGSPIPFSDIWSDSAARESGPKHQRLICIVANNERSPWQANWKSQLSVMQLL
jgi:hypothetical protein